MNYFKMVNPNYGDKDFDFDKSVGPDAKCINLCDDMILFWNKRCELYNVQNVESKTQEDIDSYYIMQGDNKMTCDFIGPSSYYANEQKLSKKEILEYIIDTREFGGHMIWPSISIGIGRYDDKGNEIRKSINQGRSYCFKERMDYTIFDIDNWYNSKFDNMNKIFKLILDGNSQWLRQFGDGDNGYRNFIDFFVLEDFVNKNYEPYDLLSYDNQKMTYSNLITKHPYRINNCIPQGKVQYQKLIEGCLYGINERSKKMNEIIMLL